MFEDATFHSGNTLHGQTQRWLLVALGINLLLLAAVIAHPLIDPDAISANFLSVPLIAPSVPVIAHPARVEASEAASEPLIAPRTVPNTTSVIQRPSSGSFSGPPDSGEIGEGLSASSSDGATGPLPTEVFRRVQPVAVKPAVQKPVSLSEGVSTGLLLNRTVPVYPVIAKAAGISGTVLLDATISTSGTIENLRVVSGNPMLRQAAIDAVRTWRYRPYLLNREPVEVETTVQVIFFLGNR